MQLEGNVGLSGRAHVHALGKGGEGQAALIRRWTPREELGGGTKRALCSAVDEDRARREDLVEERVDRVVGVGGRGGRGGGFARAVVDVPGVGADVGEGAVEQADLVARDAVVEARRRQKFRLKLQSNLPQELIELEALSTPLSRSSRSALRA